MAPPAPDGQPVLVVAVDEALLKDDALRALVEARPQSMTFRGLPSERRMKHLLARHVEA